MYDKRLKIFVALSASFLIIFILRIMHMQLVPDSSIQDKISEFKRQFGRSKTLKTLRGKITDRNQLILATDEPVFELDINYSLSSFFDERIRQVKILRAELSDEPVKAKEKVQDQIRKNLAAIQQIIDKCTLLGADRDEIEEKIRKRNNDIWNLRTFQAWRKKCSKTDLFLKYKDNLLSVKSSEFIPDFENYTDPNERLLLIDRIDIAQMHESWPILQLKTEDEIFTAQLEFMNIDGIEIVPRAKRLYPYHSAAAQTIGWVSPAHNEDIKLFADNKFLRYLGGELCGRRGIEYVCESILRGKRGEIFYDIDGNENLTETQIGKDVRLTLDIELQEKTEKFLSEYDHDPNSKDSMSAVIIEISSGDILALASLPTFDLNRARYDYEDLVTDTNNPMINRAIYKTYPPGSSVKPLILIAALQSQKITPYEIISCSASQKAPEGWPQCWITRKYSWLGHDEQWADQGGNMALNAIKGSCNIYFSRLASRIEPEVFQKWLFDFGYGRQILSPPDAVANSKYNRNLLQSSGSISSSNPTEPVKNFEQITPLKENERKMFGIGQGNLRTTPLQVANAIAAIARGGYYQQPRLFIEENYTPSATSLNLSQQTLQTIFDGMSAVVNEVNGTAYSAFTGNNFSQQNVKVYGKTGSTEKPDNAWFAGFALDSNKKGIAIAIVIEGGQSGSRDAAPLARQIIQFCIDAGYLGNPLNTTE